MSPEEAERWAELIIRLNIAYLDQICELDLEQKHQKGSLASKVFKLKKYILPTLQSALLQAELKTW